MLKLEEEKSSKKKWSLFGKNSTSPVTSSSEERDLTDEDELDIDFDDFDDRSSYSEKLDPTFYKNEVDKVNQIIEGSVKTTSSGKTNPLKILVSKQKRRFNLDGFNLDLTYVTERIIAMGFPAAKLESMYRNSMPDVQRHQGHYKIYNLCGEKKYQYSPACFNGMVGSFPSMDHQAPPLKMMFKFCEDLHEWLNKDKENVAGIHCKAGKGRTGVMICCYLLYSKQFTRAYDALKYYGMIRTKNKKGVTIPSQIRYVNYFDQALNMGWNSETIPSKTIQLTKIKLYTLPKFNMFGGCAPYFLIEHNDEIHDSRKQFPVKSYKSEAFIEFDHIEGVQVTGDVLLEFNNVTMMKKKEKMFQIWFNTSFMEPEGITTISKFMIDKACKDKNHKKFNKDFQVEFQYTLVEKKGLEDKSVEFNKTIELNQAKLDENDLPSKFSF